ncbi:hypothetical protein P43SY_003255 [Pythium insidiosum]|uniref:Uncharacterized protein n=1 Tax=Pythium insidiosum TaxID=114742 RepID=A0AAD5LBM5_PYTIN|nr:hypothetical protein P43SY_003255 [Pythium insidiosum]
MDPEYDSANLFRELIETMLLTIQAYRASYLVPRPWINNTLVLRARLVGLMVNTLLDVVYYIVVPSVLFLPYYNEFDASWAGFKPSCWFSTRWLISAITEWQMLFVTSIWDAASKLFIALSIYRALLTALTLLRPTFLALTLNGFTTVPREVMENPRLRSLMLGANPVSDLPEDVRVSPPLEVLFLDMTNVSVLPSWMDVSQLVGSASLAPLCQALQTGSGLVSADPRLPKLRRAFYCGPIPSDPRYLYQYPLLSEPLLNP